MAKTSEYLTTMLVFIIPLKSKQKCNSWKLVSDLCVRTIKSACAQQNQNFHVILVCNEIPYLDTLSALEKQKLLVLSKPYSQSDKNPGVRGDVIKIDIAAEHDKAEKLKAGFDAAVSQFQTSHVMALDADDCVSNKLSEYPFRNPASPGWYARQGYVYSEGSRLVLKKRSGFQGICGSSLIVRSDLFNATFRETDGYLFYVHGSFISLNLEPLPFPAAVYSINNGENYHMTKALKKKLVTDSSFTKLSVLFRRLAVYRIVLHGNWHVKRYGLYKLIK